jgi:hypothetical protein
MVIKTQIDILANKYQRNLIQNFFVYTRSWGLSRSCCDVFPRAGEERVMGDPNYFLQKNIIKNNSSIYVFIQDLPIFIKLVFLELPIYFRVTLVTGMDDFGAPIEIFSAKGRFKVKPPISMRQFLSDPRLHRWYVQNYDLVGCSAVEKLCSDLNKVEENIFSRKVFPIPIGIDLHTFAGKG